MLRKAFPKFLQMLFKADAQATQLGLSKRQPYINSYAYSTYYFHRCNDGIITNDSTSNNLYRNLSTTSSANQQEDDVPLAKGDKIMRTRLKSTRIDAVLKAGLQISRNKIEKAFYEDRIRLNGERPKKKSQTMSEGDEVDLVKCQNRLNPLFIDVSRVEFLEMDDNEDGDDSGDSDSDDDKKVPAKLKRYKTLTIENYEEAPWKGSDLE